MTARATFPCCVCGTIEATVAVIRFGKRVGACAGCGIVRTIDVSPEYERLYTVGLRYHGQNSTKIPYVKRYDHDLNVAAIRLPRHLTHFQGPAARTLIDVGCANGAFVAHARDAGLGAEGIEPNPYMAEWARKKTKAPIHLEWPVAGNFDVVTYHDVLEHVRNPVEELRRAHARMTLDSLLVVDTPDAETLGDVGAHHLKPLEHLWFFSAQHARRLLSLSGFSAIQIERPVPGKLVIYARPSFEGA